MKKLLLVLGVFASCLISANYTKAQSRKSISGAEVTGTFRDESGSNFSLLALGRGKLRVSFSGIYAFKTADGSDMANTGEVVGKAEIAGDTTIFKPENTEQCTITLKFLVGRRLKVTKREPTPIVVSETTFRQPEFIKKSAAENRNFRFF